MCRHGESVPEFLSVCCGSVSSAESIPGTPTCSGSASTPLPRRFLPFPAFNQYLLYWRSFSDLAAVCHLSPTSGASYPACWLSQADVWIHYCTAHHISSLRLSAPLSFFQASRSSHASITDTTVNYILRRKTPLLLEEDIK